MELLFLLSLLLLLLLFLHLIQGKMKAKAVSSLMQSLSSPDQYLGGEKEGKERVPLDRLKVGTNPKSLAVVGVAATVNSQEKVP